MGITVGGATAQFKTGWSLPGVSEEVQVRQHLVTFDTEYAAGGEPVAAADFGLTAITEIWVTQPLGYHVQYDKDNGKLVAYSLVKPAVHVGWTVTDNNDAATDGVEVYVHEAGASVPKAGNQGYLEFISPTNADGSDTVAAHTWFIEDQDLAATGGTELFIAPAGGGLYSSQASTEDIQLVLYDGHFITCTYDADPAGNQSAVQVWFDEDATLGTRFQSVVVDNLDETAALSGLNYGDSTDASSGVEVTTADDLSALACRVMVIGY
jgi:hypothetical protein